MELTVSVPAAVARRSAVLAQALECDGSFHMSGDVGEHLMWLACALGPCGCRDASEALLPTLLKVRLS